MESINPAAEVTVEAHSLILVPIRSYVRGGAQYYHDSDTLEIFHYHIEGAYFLNPSARVQAGMEYNTLHVRPEPGP